MYFWAQNFQFILAVQIKVVQLTQICEEKKNQQKGCLQDSTTILHNHHATNEIFNKGDIAKLSQK